MNVVIFGASGMVGQGVLMECLEASDVAEVLVVGRTPCGVAHPKLSEVMHKDFLNLDAVAGRLAGMDACLYCLGVSSAGMDEARYTAITVDLTMVAARAMLAANPKAAFFYVSGAGTDSSEKGRIMWARVKGRVENQLRAMPFSQVVMFRPGFIQPINGVRSKTPIYKAFYAVTGPAFPLLEKAFPSMVTTTQRVGRAMLNAVRNGAPRQVLEGKDINALAGV